MPKVNRKTAYFCSGNSAPPFVNTGVYFGQKIFSMPILGLWWFTKFWNGIFILKHDCYVREWEISIFIFHDLDGNKRQKRQVVLILNYLPKTHFQSLNISSSAISMAVFKLFCMILNNSYSKTDFLVFFFLV